MRNLAEKIIETKIEKNQIANFIRRYKDKFKNLYLRNIDN